MRIGCVQFRQGASPQEDMEKASTLLEKVEHGSLDLAIMPCLPPFAPPPYPPPSHTAAIPTYKTYELWARHQSHVAGCDIAFGSKATDPAVNQPRVPTSIARVDENGRWTARIQQVDGVNTIHFPRLGKAVIVTLPLSEHQIQEIQEKKPSIVVFSLFRVVEEVSTSFNVFHKAIETLEEANDSTAPRWTDGTSSLMALAELSTTLCRFAQPEQEVIGIFCNYAGNDANKRHKHSGTSAIMGIKDGRLRLYDWLGEQDETVLVADTNAPPREIVWTALRGPFSNTPCPHDSPGSESERQEAGTWRSH